MSISGTELLPTTLVPGDPCRGQALVSVLAGGRGGIADAGGSRAEGVCAQESGSVQNRAPRGGIALGNDGRSSVQDCLEATLTADP